MSQFVPNDSCFDSEHGRMKLLTGPNASGKSIYLKQVVLLSTLCSLHTLSLSDPFPQHHFLSTPLHPLPPSTLSLPATMQPPHSIPFPLPFL